MITEVSQIALTMAWRIKAAALAGDAETQLWLARELELDALVRGATGELSTEIEFCNDGEEGINGTITESVRA